MIITLGRLGAQDARSGAGRRSVASRYVMDDEPPENAFRDAFVAFAERYAR